MINAGLSLGSQQCAANADASCCDRSGDDPLSPPNVDHESIQENHCNFADAVLNRVVLLPKLRQGCDVDVLREAVNKMMLPTRKLRLVSKSVQFGHQLYLLSVLKPYLSGIPQLQSL